MLNRKIMMMKNLKIWRRIHRCTKMYNINANILQLGESGMNKQGGGMFNSSEEFMQASQSEGFDMTVDSMALEEFDYYEDVEDM